MKKIVFVAIIAALMFAGCGVVSKNETALEVIGTVAVEPVDSVEPIDSIENCFDFGQIVWSVRRSVGREDAYLVRYMVVAQEGELVAVVPIFNPDPEETRAVLIEAAQMPLDGTGYLDLVLTDNCYQSREQAQMAADRENGEVSG